MTEESKTFRALVRYPDGERWVVGPNPELARDVIDERAAVILLEWEDD